MPPMSNETAVIHLPDLGETLTKVWHLLFDLSEGVPRTCGLTSDQTGSCTASSGWSTQTRL
jgi:hypothetical protein